MVWLDESSQSLCQLDKLETRLKVISGDMTTTQFCLFLVDNLENPQWCLLSFSSGSLTLSNLPQAGDFPKQTSPSRVACGCLPSSSFHHHCFCCGKFWVSLLPSRGLNLQNPFSQILLAWSLFGRGEWGWKFHSAWLYAKRTDLKMLLGILHAPLQLLTFVVLLRDSLFP